MMEGMVVVATLVVVDGEVEEPIVREAMKKFLRWIW
jgi:hypothetical protein